MATVPVALVPATYAASVLLRAERSDKPSGVLWLQDEIASRLLRAYESETGAMPRIVAGPVREAGLVALAALGAPSVSIDGDERKSPWVSAGDVAGKGAARPADRFGTRAGPGCIDRRVDAAAGNLPVERLFDRPPDPDHLDDSPASGSLKTKKRLSRYVSTAAAPVNNRKPIR